MKDPFLTDDEAAYWSRGAMWKSDDAAKLLLGLDPRWPRLSVADTELDLVLREIDRCTEFASSIWNIWRPKDWIKAADAAHLSVPQNLRAAVVGAAPDAIESQKQETYSTPHLAIMQAAIAEFFEPRRDFDAKKPEVVEWIKGQMTAAGMADSDNIAQAMFTIIKPSDHDPRKRRG